MSEKIVCTQKEILKKEILIQKALLKKQCENNYYNFFQFGWSVLEPSTPLKLNWHIEYICNVLQEVVENVANGKLKDKDVIINVPPRSGKSYLVSMLLAPWTWTKYPHLKFINSSHSNSLSTNHCLKSRRLIESPQYQELWSKAFQMTTDQNVKSHFENDKHGARIATSVGSGITGHGADIIIADDLVDAKNKDSETYLDSANEYFTDTLFTRLNDQDTGVRIVIMQRLNEDDLTGHLMANYPDDYLYISIPAELKGDKNLISPKSIQKKYKNNLFFQDRFTRKFLDTALKAMGPRKYAGQYLQSPSPLEGNLIKREYWNYYDELPKRFDEVIQSWDFSFKGDNENSFVVGQVWGRWGANAYLIDQVRDHMDFNKSREALIRMTKMYPDAILKLIEDKANGPAIIADLKSKIAGLREELPEGSKRERAELVLPIIMSGNVFLPNPKHRSWVNGFIDEHARFTGDKKKKEINDQVDAMTQAIKKLLVKNAVAELEQLLNG